MPPATNLPLHGADSMRFSFQIRAMIDALKRSKEPEHLVKEAARYLKGLRGRLVKTKKQKAAKELAAQEAAKVAQLQNTNTPIGQ